MSKSWSRRRERSQSRLHFCLAAAGRQRLLSPRSFRSRRTPTVRLARLSCLSTLPAIQPRISSPSNPRSSPRIKRPPRSRVWSANRGRRRPSSSCMASITALKTRSIVSRKSCMTRRPQRMVDVSTDAIVAVAKAEILEELTLSACAMSARRASSARSTARAPRHCQLRCRGGRPGWPFVPQGRV